MIDRVAIIMCLWINYHLLFYQTNNTKINQSKGSCLDDFDHKQTWLKKIGREVIYLLKLRKSKINLVSAMNKVNRAAHFVEIS